MKKSLLIKVLAIIILVLSVIIIRLSFVIIHDNKETDIVEKEEETYNNEYLSNNKKVISSWEKCEEDLTCYLEEGEYKIGKVVYSTSIIKNPYNNAPFPYPTEEDVQKENLFIENQGLKVVVTSDGKFIIKGNNYEEELTLNYDSFETGITSVTSQLLNYNEQRYFRISELNEDVFFRSPGVKSIYGYYGIEVVEINGELYIVIHNGIVSYIHMLDKISTD